MSLEKFEMQIGASTQVGENDRVWFPRWIRRYALSVRKGLVNDLPVNRESTLRFSRTLLESGAPAWQRWQASLGNFIYKQTGDVRYRTSFSIAMPLPNPSDKWC